jgi:dTDP-glucose 4,6-dehydratase
MSRVLVTGCLGFIGSYFVKYILKNFPHSEVVGINRLSNQKNTSRLKNVLGDKRFSVYWADFAKDNITEAFRDIDTVVHFGAKTFVDYSIRDPSPFIESNVVGTYKILEEVRKSQSVERYVQVSTDEVYGSILEGKYKEDARPNPTNPYAATKMAADSLVLSYHNSYGINTIITRTENNYGPYQGAEKVFPVFIRKALENKPLPVYGDGKHKRMWLYVEDHCRAIDFLVSKGKSGEIYHVAGEQELMNIELAEKILELTGKDKTGSTELIPDHNIRPGHDRRYALDCEKIKAIGWKAEWSIEEGFKKAVDWYIENKWWFM